ncbi:hypothetical protein [Actinoplanes sp. NPDC051411]|uniref:hypothetical protein n=1 Tax=Actinoplanes sp. NPDC051411 TaxID=3155522 RepID=UPI003430048C
MFDPLQHHGIPADRHDGHWREQDDPLTGGWPADPYLRCRVTTAAAVEIDGARRYRRMLAGVDDVDARRGAGALGEAAGRRGERLAGLLPTGRSPRQRTADDREARSRLLGWLERSEPDPPAVALAARVRRTSPAEAGGWAAMVLHEATACYLYHAFLHLETDRRLRALWELHLQMALTRLRTAGDLLRRHEGGEPRMMIGAGFADPLPMDDRRPRRGRRGRPADLVELLGEQHDRMAELFRHAVPTTRTRPEAAHATFGRLARLITAHEVIAAELAHPLMGHLDPDGHLAEHLLDEEGELNEALEDAVRADAAGRPETRIDALRRLVVGHGHDERRYELPRLRAAVPGDERRALGRAARAAEQAAGVDHEPAEVTPQELPGIADSSRDAVHAAV